ncbi:MAG TPA: response regulator, partial [Albitalea sp.]
IPPEQLPTVFDLFSQADRSYGRAQGGLGIGLTLVRRLAELHGGRVEAFSEGPGRGSEFVLRLPAIEPAATAAREAAPPAAAAARTVVVVEDNADLRGALRELLEMEGHRVHEAADGVEGVRQVLAVQPDLALVDVGLPLMDGHALARAVRAQATRPVRLVAMTGYGHRDDLAAAAAAGFDACLVKPVDPAKLLRLLGEG